MKIVKTQWLFLVTVFLFLSGCSISKMPFYIERYEKNPGKIAPKFIEVEGIENLKAYSFQRVAILEFNVEYHIDMPEDFYRKVADEMYEMFAQSLVDNTGWEVVAKNTLRKSKTFKALRKDENIKYNRKRKIGKNKQDMFSAVTPVTGLGILPTEQVHGKRSISRYFLKTSKEPRILEELNADALIKVNTVVDYFRRGSTGRARIVPSVKHFEGFSSVSIDVGYTKTPAITADNQKKYDYIYNGHCSFSLKDPLNSYGEFEVKRGTFDLDEYIYWVKEMFWIYSEMLGIELSRNL